MTAILTVSNMTKRFGGLVAVDTLNVTIQENSIHSIIGPNGAGKTTFFNCVTGFYKPEEGSILFDNHSLVGLLPDRIVKMTDEMGLSQPLAQPVSAVTLYLETPPKHLDLIRTPSDGEQP